jgi:hypothetical protein
VADVAVEVKIADSEQFQALMRSLRSAAESFATLSDEERAALPGAARDGIDTLIAAARPESGSDEEHRAFHGRVIIEWPPPRNGILASWGCAIYDAETGKLVTTASKVMVTADVQDLITCNLVMFADEDGNPVFDGKPRFRDDRIITGTFPFIVAEMRVRS